MRRASKWWCLFVITAPRAVGSGHCHLGSADPVGGRGGGGIRLKKSARVASCSCVRGAGWLVGWEDGEGLRWKGRVVRAVGCASPRQARLGLARPGEPAGLRRHRGRGGAGGRAGCALAVELNLSGAGGRNGRGCQCHHHQVASIPRALYLLFQAAQRGVRTYVLTGRRPASPNLTTFVLCRRCVGGTYI